MRLSFRAIPELALIPIHSQMALDGFGVPLIEKRKEQ